MKARKVGMTDISVGCLMGNFSLGLGGGGWKNYLVLQISNLLIRELDGGWSY